MNFFRKSDKSKVGKAQSKKHSDNAPPDIEKMRIRTEKEYGGIPIPLEVLSEADLELFSLVVSGKVDEVKQTIEAHFIWKNLTNKVDEHGYTICHIAVHRQDEEMLTYLLTLPNIEALYYDLLLHATLKQSRHFVIKILHAIKNRFPNISNPSSLEPWDHSEFSKDITPLILAAQVGNYELIKLFSKVCGEFEPQYVDDDGKIKRDHSNSRSPAGLAQHYSRLHEYEARTSPEMLCYLTNSRPYYDPILVGMKLLAELKEVGMEEHEFKNQYRELRVKLQQFLVGFLDGCRTTEDLMTLLSETEGYHGDLDTHPRIIMAIENRFEDFITHGHCQKTLYIQWAGASWPEWRTCNTPTKSFYIFSRLFLAPFICIWLYFDCFSKPSEFFRAPVNVCIHHFVSYIYFMILLAAEAYLMTRPENANLHGTPCRYLEYAIAIFVMGHIMTMIRSVMASPRAFCNVSWYIYDIITCFVFGITIFYWILLWCEPEDHITSPRTHWLYNDYVLVSQATFAVGLVLTYGGFMRFFQLYHRTGPMQIAMSDMIWDISVFTLFFAVTLFSFAVSFYFIYSPFHGAEIEVEGELQAMKSQFTTFPNALHSLYWALLGMADQDHAGIIPFYSEMSHHDHVHNENNEGVEERSALDEGSEGEDNSTEPLLNELHATEYVGMGLWMVYHMVGPMILMNLLTGYMGNTFNRVSENMIPTWKFNRSKIWIYYIRCTALPSPFNILPSVEDLLSIYSSIISATSTSGFKGSCSCRACAHLETQVDLETREKRKNVYYKLMTKLVARYLRAKLEVNETDVATNEDVDNIADQVGQLKLMLTTTLEQHLEAEGQAQGDFARSLLGRAAKGTGRKTSATYIGPNVDEGIEKFWHADERWYRQYETDPSFGLRWMAQARPVPSPMRQFFTPPGSNPKLKSKPMAALGSGWNKKLSLQSNPSSRKSESAAANSKNKRKAAEDNKRRRSSVPI